MPGKQSTPDASPFFEGIEPIQRQLPPAVGARTSAEAFLEKIETIQRQLKDSCSYITKLKARLEKTKKALKTKPSITAPFNLLLSDLQAAKPAPEAPNASQIIDAFEGQLRSFQRNLHERFPSGLRDACEGARLEFKAMTDGFGVGPFVVVTNLTKETAAIQYAKVVVLQDLPMSVQTIVAQATALKANLIDAWVDLARFRKDIHEAIRVACARRDSRSLVADLRVELPAAFREMCLIRNTTASNSAKKSGSDDYSLTRFIIELRQFLQSDDNLESPMQCRLEPAVIENTRNAKKSIFIPSNVACGFGEGTYYQAIILQQM